MTRLQSLLNIYTEYCQLYDLTVNAKKISGTICEFANEVKYLDVMINSSFKTTIDVKRQTRNFYARAKTVKLLTYKFATLDMALIM